MPSNNQLLASDIDGTLGSVGIPSPSGGLPTGKSFRVNLIKGSDVSTIFAQSDEFEIVAGTASASGSVSVATSSSTGSSST